MPAVDRLERITELVEERGFLSVGELSAQLLQVSEMTIRRDLGKLDEAGKVQRTYGGAASLRSGPASTSAPEEQPLSNKPEGILLNRVDVLIASSVNPKYDALLLERAGKKNIPVIAESLAINNQETVVAVDNYQAAVDLGKWVGNYAQEQWDSEAHLLNSLYTDGGLLYSPPFR